MLFKPLGTSRLQRVQGAFVTEDEVALIVEQTRVQREQEVDETFLEAPQVFADDGDADDGEFDPDEDPLLDRAIEVVVAAADRLRVAAAAAAAGRLHARRPPDRHARAARDHLARTRARSRGRVLIAEADLERLA